MLKTKAPLPPTLCPPLPSQTYLPKIHGRPDGMFGGGRPEVVFGGGRPEGVFGGGRPVVVFGGGRPEGVFGGGWLSSRAQCVCVCDCV